MPKTTLEGNGNLWFLRRCIDGRTSLVGECKLRLAKQEYAFPPAELADAEYDGLLAVEGDYEPERLLEAYTHGIFPWPVAAGEMIPPFSRAVYSS